MPTVTTTPEPEPVVVKRATFETNTDNHVAWYGATVTRSTVNPIGGVGSLLVTAKDRFTGVQLNNFPYFTITAGATYDFSVKYREAAGTMAPATWKITWRDSAGGNLRTELISMPRATTTAEAKGTFTAPLGAVKVKWEFTTTSSPVNSAYQLDDILVRTG